MKIIGANEIQRRRRMYLTIIIMLAVLWACALFVDSRNKERALSEEYARWAALTPEQQARESEERVNEADKKVREERLSSVLYVCRSFIKMGLHDPDSAQFDNSGTDVAKENKGVYKIQVHFRAKNGFNALRHEAIDCETTFRDGNWHLLSLKEVK